MTRANARVSFAAHTYAALNGGAGATGNISWTVPNWFVNPVAGDDGNTGTSPSTALKTVNQIVTRWGTPSPALVQTTTIHLLASEPVGTVYDILAPTLIGPVNFIVLGALTPVTGFAAGTVTPLNQSAGGHDLLVGGFSDPAVLPGQLVKNNTRGSSAIIDSITDGVATMCQPFAQADIDTVTALPIMAEDHSWATGDALVVSSLPTMNLKVLNPNGGDSDPSFSTGAVWIQNINVPDISGVPGTSSFAPTPTGVGLTFMSCNFDVFLTANCQDQALGAAAINCRCNGGGQYTNIGLIGGSTNTAGNQFSRFEDISVVDGNVIVHGEMLVKGPYLRAGEAHFDTGPATLTHGGIVVIETSGSLTTGTCVLWGSASLNLEGPNSGVTNATGGLWANCLRLGALTLEGVATGTRYAANNWSDGVPITAANLDSTNGLQNPRTGSRFATI